MFAEGQYGNLCFDYRVVMDIGIGRVPIFPVDL